MAMLRCPLLSSVLRVVRLSFACAKSINEFVLAPPSRTFPKPHRLICDLRNGKMRLCPSHLWSGIGHCLFFGLTARSLGVLCVPHRNETSCQAD